MMSIWMRLFLIVLCGLVAPLAVQAKTVSASVLEGRPVD